MSGHTDKPLVERLGPVLDIIAAAEMQWALTDEHHAYYSDCHAAVNEALEAIGEDEVTEEMIERGYAAAKADGLTGPRKDCEKLVELILRASLQQPPTATEEHGHDWRDNDRGGQDNVTEMGK